WVRSMLMGGFLRCPGRGGSVPARRVAPQWRSTVVERALGRHEGWAAADQQVLGGGFLAAVLGAAQFAPPQVAALLQRLLAGTRAEIGGAGLVLRLLGLAQRGLRLLEAALRGNGELGQVVDVALALRQRLRPGN